MATSKILGESMGLFIHFPWHLPTFTPNSFTRTLTPTTTSFAIAAVNASRDMGNQNIQYNGIYPLPLPGQLFADVTQSTREEYIKSINSTLLAQIEEKSSLSAQLTINNFPSSFGSFYNKPNLNYISRDLHNKVSQQQTLETCRIITKAGKPPPLQQVFETQFSSNRATTLSVPNVRLPSSERPNDSHISMSCAEPEHTKKVNDDVSLTALQNIQIQTPPSSSAHQMSELFVQPSLLPPNMLQFSQTPALAANLRAFNVGQLYHDNYHNQYRNPISNNTGTLVSAAESLQLYKSISEHKSPLREVVLQTKSTMTGPLPYRNSPTTANSTATVVTKTNMSVAAGTFTTPSMGMKAQPATIETLINTLQPSYISLPHTSLPTPMFTHRKPPSPPPHSPKYREYWKVEETSSHETSTSALPLYVRKSLTQNANNICDAASNDQTARLSQLTNTHKHTHAQDHIHNKNKSRQKQRQKQKQTQKSKQKQQERVTYTSLGYTSNGEQLFVRHFHERDRLIREHQLKHRICNTFSANSDDFDGDVDGDGRGRQTTTHHEETTACLGSPGTRESLAVAITNTTSASVCAPNSTAAAAIAGDVANGIAFVNNAHTKSNNSVDNFVPQVEQDQTKRATAAAVVGALVGVRIDDTDAARDDLARFKEITARDDVEISTATDTSPKVMVKCAPNPKMTKQRSAYVAIAGE